MSVVAKRADEFPKRPQPTASILAARLRRERMLLEIDDLDDELADQEILDAELDDLNEARESDDSDDGGRALGSTRPTKTRQRRNGPRGRRASEVEEDGRSRGGSSRGARGGRGGRSDRGGSRSSRDRRNEGGRSSSGRGGSGDYGRATPMAKRTGKVEMFINYAPGEECRIAVTENGQLDELYQERASNESHVGNIYKGKVTNVEPSIQAAFIDFGLDRNGFLHISDLHPMYFKGKDHEDVERVGSKTPRRQRPAIQDCLRRGDEVLVQILKEGIGNKGPTLTSYLSIPGRFVVMMPNMSRLGVSRKVEDEDQRREMRKILADLDPPEGFGFIVRTAGIGQPKADLKRDLAYLARLWKSIERRRKRLRRVGELYAESDLIIRTIRDVFTNEIDRIIIDDETAAARVQDFLSIANPRHKSKVLYYDDPVPIFHRFGIEKYIDNMYAREVPLPSGGSLVIDQTEALVAIDVNSGKSRDAKDAETNAYQTNVEACDEICRQLRLRDLGGVVVNDLIDMRDLKHRRKIETRFRNNLRRDRARTRINSISQFGLLEMTRQRMRPSFRKSISIECPHCHGTGHVKSSETVAIEVMRKLALVMHHEPVSRIELTVSPDTAFQLLNNRRRQMVAMEQRFNCSVLVRVGGNTIDYIGIIAYDERGTTLDTGGMMDAPADRDPRKANLVELSSEQTEAAIVAIAEAGGVEQAEQAQVDSEAKAAIKSDAAKARRGESSYGEIDEEDDDDKPRRRRRRRRRGRGRDRDREEAHGDASDSDANDRETTESSEEVNANVEDDESTSKRRRRKRGSRGGRGRRKRDESGSDEQEASSTDSKESEAVASSEAASSSNDQDDEKPTRRRKKSTRRTKGQAKDDVVVAEIDHPDATDEDKPQPRRRKKSTRRKKSSTKKSTDDAATEAKLNDKGSKSSKDKKSKEDAKSTKTAKTETKTDTKVKKDQPKSDTAETPKADAGADSSKPKPSRLRRGRKAPAPAAASEASRGYGNKLMDRK